MSDFKVESAHFLYVTQSQLFHGPACQLEIMFLHSGSVLWLQPQAQDSNDSIYIYIYSRVSSDKMYLRVYRTYTYIYIYILRLYRTSELGTLALSVFFSQAISSQQ